MPERFEDPLKPMTNEEKKNAEKLFNFDDMIDAVNAPHPSKPEDEAKKIIEFMQDCKTIEEDLASKKLMSFQSKVKTDIDIEKRTKKRSPRLHFLKWVKTAYNHFSGENNILFGKNRKRAADHTIINRILHYTHGNDQTRFLSALLYTQKYSLFAKSTLQEIAFEEFLELLNQLIHKDPTTVIEILKQRPALKNIRASVIDRFGIRYNNVTFYEAALYLGNARILQQIETCYTPLELNELNGKKFLTYVLQGNENAVKAMLDEDPTLLNYRGTAHDRTGRIYKEVTGYQAAYLCADLQMLKMMDKYFTSEEEKLSQHHTLFPNSNIENALENQAIFNFTKIVKAIDNAKDKDINRQLIKELNDSTLCQKINKFRDDFKQISLNEVLVNLKHLIKAYQIYKRKFHNWPWNKRNLFFCQVIGFIQAISLPENIKQIHHQSLWAYIEVLKEGKTPINERLGVHTGEGSLHLSSECGFYEALGLAFIAGSSPPLDWHLLDLLMSNIHNELSRIIPTGHSHPQQSITP